HIKWSNANDVNETGDGAKRDRQQQNPLVTPQQPQIMHDRGEVVRFVDYRFRPAETAYRQGMSSSKIYGLVATAIDEIHLQRVIHESTLVPLWVTTITCSLRLNYSPALR